MPPTTFWSASASAAILWLSQLPPSSFSSFRPRSRFGRYGGGASDRLPVHDGSVLNSLGWGFEIELLICTVWCEAGEGPHREREGPQRTRAGSAGDSLAALDGWARRPANSWLQSRLWHQI